MADGGVLVWNSKWTFKKTNAKESKIRILILFLYITSSLTQTHTHATYVHAYIHLLYKRKGEKKKQIEWKPKHTTLKRGHKPFVMVKKSKKQKKKRITTTARGRRSNTLYYI